MNNEWKMKDGRVLYLLTIQELQELAPYVMICDIFGKQRHVHEEGKEPPDLDTRFGYTAWGLVSAIVPAYCSTLPY